jgi:hypothetical protein
MKDYVALADAYFQAHVDAAAAEENPHRRAIIQNYIEHAALEYTKDRWQEILLPERTVEDPVYHIRLGTPRVLHLRGLQQVHDFYATIKEGVLTNEFINLAVADWGLCEFAKTHLFIPGATLARQGAEVDGKAFYHVEMPLVGLYWNYDAQARLVSENVYDILPPILTKIHPADAPSAEEVDEVVQKYVPKRRADAAQTHAAGR